MNSRFSAFAIALLAFCLLTGCITQPPHCQFSKSIKTDANYGSHMVLQRDREICISGYGEAGAMISVQLGPNKAVFCEVDSNGRWTAQLPAMQAGGPYTLKITGDASCAPIVFEDVLIGEVWICSGQSNMEMPIFSSNPFWRDNNYAALLAESEQYPLIRIFNDSPHKKVSPRQEQLQPKASWQLANADTLKEFSATGYNFGRQLSEDLPGIPIGLINVSWSGTRIEPWISKTGYELANYQNELKSLELSLLPNEAFEEQRQREIENYKSSQSNWSQNMSTFKAAEAAAAADWKNPVLDDSAWMNLTTGDNAFPSGEEGIAWFRKTITIPEQWIGHDLTLNLGVIDDCDWTYVNGELVGKILTDTFEYWKAPRIYDIPASLITSDTVTIAIRMADLYDQGGLQNQGEGMSIQCPDIASPSIDIGHDWKFKVESTFEVAALGGQPMLKSTLLPADDPQVPTTLYNGLIAPWIKYPVRGVIWYQGCSNASQSEQYFHLQQLLVNDWRRAWKNPELAFIICQLSGYYSNQPETRGDENIWRTFKPGTGIYAQIRDVQWRSIRQLPNTGMAVTYDAGDLYDIHPHNKGIVGYRLAKEAERICYGNTGITSGPEFARASFSNNGQVTIYFTNVGGGLIAQDNPEGKIGACAIAGDDGNFVAADAVIENDTLVISSPAVPNPKEVRYGWISYSEDINLYNADGFPALPFKAIKQ